ncbi:MAG: thioesterase [Hyphomonas sp.]|uniref:thioesterase family protein n=1 Tax=Hyphomonas sp. TaxID=87 RepID=UPI0017EFBC16|nr:thioesterase family protein [Hyphomonas sp.]MBA3069517.1 thioesterase [Hyphomonas sp.]MBU3921787.1 thioesterase family protein [Alphaproteobacteria bacterium]MBU4063322.1 thioesterase family protein [Alphaproteobacteria bacterium]MBU4164140.1 thioesterase family protein [Alphaproteobacteria bacterium]
MIPLWQGSCNQWDCDEMGHMNVRVYVEKQLEGLVALCHAAGMPNAFRPNSPSTVSPVDQHIRFIREVLPGRPLMMKGCVLEIGESDAVIYQELRHADGTLSAAFRTRIAHLDTAEGKAFPWTRRVLAKLASLKDTTPDEAKPRSFDPDAPGLPLAEITLARVEAVGAPRIGLGAVPSAHCGAHGWMTPSWIIGRVSDSVPNLLFDWRTRVGENSGGRRMGAAVLEYRLRYHRLPREGDQFVIHTSLGKVAGKTHNLVHWVMDPQTGGPWATCEVIAISLDLDARKAVEAPPEMIGELEKIAPRGLGI